MASPFGALAFTKSSDNRTSWRVPLRLPVAPAARATSVIAVRL